MFTATRHVMMTIIETIIITMTMEIVRLTRSSFEENLFRRMHFRGEREKARRSEEKARVRLSINTKDQSSFIFRTLIVC